MSMAKKLNKARGHCIWIVGGPSTIFRKLRERVEHEFRAFVYGHLPSEGSTYTKIPKKLPKHVTAVVVLVDMTGHGIAKAITELCKEEGVICGHGSRKWAKCRETIEQMGIPKWTDEEEHETEVEAPPAPAEPQEKTQPVDRKPHNPETTEPPKQSRPEPAQKPKAEPDPEPPLDPPELTASEAPVPSNMTLKHAVQQLQHMMRKAGVTSMAVRLDEVVNVKMEL